MKVTALSGKLQFHGGILGCLTRNTDMDFSVKPEEEGRTQEDVGTWYSA